MVAPRRNTTEDLDEQLESPQQGTDSPFDENAGVNTLFDTEQLVTPYGHAMGIGLWPIYPWFVFSPADVSGSDLRPV